MSQAGVQQQQRNLSDPRREEVIRTHMGLVYQTVERIGGQVARSTGSYDDLVSAGMVGLLNAFDAYDPDRGVEFSTYAHPRVRGAVLDELRRMDSVPRSVRRKRREIDAASRAVSSRSLGRASERDVAAELGVDVATLWKWEADCESGCSESIDANPAQESVATLQIAADWSVGEMPDAALEREEDVDMVRRAIARLPEQERVVLILSFYENLKLRQIGEIIGVSESRVSQIRTRAISLLREEVAPAPC